MGKERAVFEIINGFRNTLTEYGRSQVHVAASKVLQLVNDRSSITIDSIKELVELAESMAYKNNIGLEFKDPFFTIYSAQRQTSSIS